MEQTYSRYTKGQYETIEDLQSAFESCCNCGIETDEQKIISEKSRRIDIIFQQTLTEQQKEIDRQLNDLRSEEMVIISRQAFIQGYKIATRLLLESMK